MVDVQSTQSQTMMMIEHLHRWLLATLAVYLALQPTNAATYIRSVTFGLASLFGLLVVIASVTGRDERIPSPGAGVLLALVTWCLWDFASLAWSLHPNYTAGELRREILFGLMMMGAVYVAMRDVRAWYTLVGAALSSFALLAAMAVGLAASPSGWDAGRWHVGVGAFSTYIVLIAPLMLTLLAPPPVGFGTSRVSVLLGVLLLVLILATARMSDNRMVWVALVIVFATMSGLAAFRWRSALAHAPMRWLAPLFILLVVLGAMFAQTAIEKARLHFPPSTSIAQTFTDDPRLALWERTIERIESHPWLGHGFGKSILDHELREELHDPMLSHAHNIFASQWLQTGAIGFAAFVALLVALLWRYAELYRAKDDALAVLGIMGIALIMGFVIKNLTDDFLLRSNGKEFWMLNAALLGFGARRAAAALPDASTPANG